MKIIFLALIKFYKKLISPLLGNHCRFYPTCSDYAYQSISKHGAMKGLYLAIRRILKCHPFNAGGYDPVP